MKISKLLLLWIFSKIFCADGSQNDDVGVDKIKPRGYLRPCYFTNWAQYRPGRGKYMPEDYISGLCTHILYAFGWMNSDFTVRAYDPSDLDTPWKKGMYSRVNNLKKKDLALKTSLSFGGWTFGTWLFKSMSTTEENRNVFIKSAIAFVRKHNFDGIDIDWEYPKGPEDMKHYSLLIKELRKAVEAESIKTKQERLLISAAVSAGESIVDKGYDVPEIAKWFDFVLLMSYDFHGAWERKTDFNSPLYNRLNETEKFKHWNVNFSANLWLAKGMPKEKIVIGLPTYARGWSLKNPSVDGVGAPASGPSKPTKFVRTSGVAAYYEICEMIASGAKTVWSSEQEVPYLVQGNQWFSYDDEKSFRVKMKWLKTNGYGGAFVWNLDFDDFNGKCLNGHGKKFPLISVIQEELSGMDSNTSTTGATSSKTTSATTAPTGDCSHKQDGFFPSPVDCSKFILCLEHWSYSLSCPEHLHFSSKLQYCTKPQNSGCEDSLTLQTTQTPVVTSSMIEKTTQTTTRTTKSFTCPGDGFYRDPSNCDHFYRCSNGTPYKFACPRNLCFDSSSKLCHYPENCDCTNTLTQF